jgi:membrane protein implicated in regulation of membrane protease activity
MDTFFGNAYTFWFCLAFLLLSCEIILGAEYYLLCVAIAASTVGILTWLLTFTWQWQVCWFAFFTLVFVYLWFRMWIKMHKKDHSNHLNQKLTDLQGKIALVVKDIEAGQNGSIKLGDTIWKASSSQTILKGEKVKIVNFDGIITIVEKHSSIVLDKTV